MGKPRKEHPDEESIFANNPFIEGFFEWMDSPEGEKHLEIYDVVSKLLEDVRTPGNAKSSGLTQNGSISSNLFSASRNCTATSPRRDRGVYD